MIIYKEHSMKEIITQMATDSVQSQRIAQSLAAVTASSGVATFLEILTPIVGLLAASFGAILSVAFFLSNRKRNKREEEKHSIEMKLLLKQLNE